MRVFYTIMAIMTLIIVFLHTNGNDDFDDNNEHNDNSLLRGRLHGTLSSYADAPPRPVQLSLLTKMSKKNFYYY